MAIDPGITQAVIFIAVALGVATRTLMPYLDKAQAAEQAGQEIKFLNKYKFTTAISFIVAVISASGLFPTVLAEVDQNSTLFGAFLFSFFYGYGWNALLNRASDKATETTSKGEVKPTTDAAAATP